MSYMEPTVLIANVTNIWIQKRKVRPESGTPGDWLGPSDQRQVESPAPASYVYNFL